MKIIKTLLFICISHLGLAQNSIGILAEPSYQLTKIKGTPIKTLDSLQNIKHNDKVLNISLEFRKQIDRFQAVSFSPLYYQSNFLVILEDLHFLDVIHPGLPEIRDLSQAATKNANLHYRFKYFGTRFLYHRKLKSLYNNNGVNFDFSIGLTYLYMLGQDVKIRTEGFAIKDKFTHIIKDSIAFTGRNHNVNINFGADANYNISPNVELVAGILINLPLLSTSNNEISLSVYAPSLKVGLRKIL